MAGEYIEFDNNNQPAVNDTNLNTLQQLIKQDIVGTVGGDTMPIGAILQFDGATIPTNWLLCDGSAVSRTEYQDLFNTVGIKYGQGDGFTTFNLPNLSSANTNYIIKAYQTAGIVSNVIDNLNSTSATDALSANQGNAIKNLLDGTVLYNNASGSSATITLNESSANFKRIQIEYFENRDNVYGTVDVLNPNGKSVWFHNYFVGTNVYIYFAKITISGTQITWNKNERFNLINNVFNTDYIHLITKVTGYNY